MKKLPVLCRISTKRCRLAVGRAVPGGFLVFAGSTAAADSVASTPTSVVDLRAALVAARILVSGDDRTGQLVFAQDYVFASSSAAASLVMGLSANGKDAWRVF